MGTALADAEDAALAAKVGAVGGVVGWDGPLRSRGLARLRRIWELAAEHFGDRVEIVDYYPASQHLWDVARAQYSDVPVAQADGAAPLARRLRHEGVAPILDALAAAIAPGGTPAADTLRRERAFFQANAARMASPPFRAQRPLVA